MVVYVDVLILLNFYVDYFLILGTEKLCRCSVKISRRLIGAVVSSLFSLVIFLPEMNPMVSVTVKLLCSSVTVAVVFGIKSFRCYFSKIFVFFAISYSFAGGMLALSNIFSVQGVAVQNSAVYCNISPLLLLSATTVFYLIIRLYQFVTRRNLTSGQKVSLSITYSDTTVSTKALLDTGNNLTDAINGAPIIVISKNTAEGLLGKNNVESMIRFDLSSNKPSGFRLIPYNVVGSKGVLPAFKPDKVLVDGKLYQQNVYIAISPTSLSDDTQAIVGPDLIYGEGGAKCCSRG